MAQTLAKIHQMEAITLENDQPQVEGGSAAIAMHSDPSYNFADRDAYETPYVDELQTMAMINFLLDRGEGFVSMLYTYRSCSKATPQVKTQDQENKGELYQNLFAVLEPEIAKLKDFMRFTDEAIDVFCGMVTEMSNPKRSSKTIFSENLIMSLIQMADLFVVLDALKNMKACLNNDFAFYKRAFGFLRKQSALTDSEQIENQNTYLFLAHQNRIATTLKSKLHPSPQEPGIPGFEAAIQEMLEFAATQFEEANYLLPKEKHMLLRVMPFFIYLMDGEDPNNAKTSIFRSKKVRMARYITIFQRYPIVPLYADMHITSSSFIERCKHYDDSVWGRPLPEARLEEDYNITNNLVAYRNFHQRYSAEFANMINEVRAVTDSGRQISSGQGRQIYTLVLQGFHLLSRLTSAVLEQSAWKYSRPSQNIPLDRPMEDIFEYEKVVRYNYDSEERFALIEMIGMVKSLAALVTQSSGKLAGIIRRCIHDEVQEFIQVTLRDMIRQATKKKKSTRSTLVNLRFMAADWLGGIEPKDPALTGKKDPKDGFKIQIPSRSAGPSLTQLTLIRSIVFSLFSDKSPGMKKSGLFSDKAFNNSQVQDLSAFYARSYYYSYLLDIGGTVTQLSDLSLLWYREFYLEISKQMQFPIEMSLPWILAEHILENEAPHYMEHLFFPLDLYNDAASRALSVLEQRFVFDEIEAEVNLCFDQLVYKLCELTFAQFKEAASVIQLDKTYREELEKMVPASKLAVPKNRLAVVLAQRHFQLLGRSIDLNALVAQRMNIYLRTNLDYVISKFEASPLSGVMELEASLENVRIVHSLLSEHLTLDPFDLMLADVNDGASLVSFLSRISIHVTQEIIVDLIPNYAYNSSTHRFVKPDMIFTEAFSRDPMPKIPPNYLFGSKILNAAFANVFELQKGFVGAPHFGAMYRVMGRSTLALVLADVAKYIQTKIVGTVQPYVTQLLEGMPDSSKLPQFTYGSAGVKGLLEAKLEPILGYAELKTEVFQVFREVGNSIVVHALLDRVMAVSDTQTAVLAHRFLEGEPLGQVMAAAGPAMRASAVSQAIAGGLGSAAQLAADLYAIPAEGDNVSLLRHYLLEVDAMLDPVRNEWQGPPPADGVLEIDESYEFYRLYSAMLFAFNLGERAKQFSNQDLFGDGFHWAGMTFVYAMRQQHRFNIFDFSYHCYNVEAAAAEKDPSLADFVSNARLAKEINSHILATLQAVVPQAPVDAYAFPINPPTNDEAKTMIANLPGQF